MRKEFRDSALFDYCNKVICRAPTTFTLSQAPGEQMAEAARLIDILINWNLLDKARLREA